MYYPDRTCVDPLLTDCQLTSRKAHLKTKMNPPEFPSNEYDRQAAVERYNILDTLPEENYDNITALIARVTDSPVSLITMLDKKRNFLKSHYGVEFNQSPREISFCGHAINAEEEIMIVEDASKDTRFHDNPLVTDGGVRFYAGVPLVTPDAYKLGTLCIFDTKPRVLDEDLQVVLINAARQVETILAHRYQNQLLIDYRRQLELRNKELENFAKSTAHDIKSPVISALYLAESFVEDYSDVLPDSALERLNKIAASTTSVCKYIDALLDYYTCEKILLNKRESVVLADVLDEVKELTGSMVNHRVAGTALEHKTRIDINRGALLQILANLITNAIKFCDKEVAEVQVDFKMSQSAYEFSVADNGAGISEEVLPHIFDIYTQGNIAPGDGTGLGLASVKKIVDRMGGEMTVESTVGIGSRFSFTVPKQSIEESDALL